VWVRWARRSLLALSLVLASFLGYLLVTRSESIPASSEGQAALRQEDAGIDQFTFTQSKDGRVQWQVQAQRAKVFEREKRAVLEDVQVTLFGRKGWELKLAGDEGTIDTDKHDFVLARRNGAIAVELESGYTIFTNHLAWVDADRRITTNDSVKITGHGLDITGQGFVGKLDKEEFRILEDVQVEITQ
jgi:LPS export ABC transporter protein LptC